MTFWLKLVMRLALSIVLVLGFVSKPIKKMNLLDFMRNFQVKP
jgi:hypothetical protein